VPYWNQNKKPGATQPAPVTVSSAEMNFMQPPVSCTHFLTIIGSRNARKIMQWTQRHRRWSWAERSPSYKENALVSTMLCRGRPKAQNIEAEHVFSSDRWAEVALSPGSKHMFPTFASRVFQPTSANEGVKFKWRSEGCRSRNFFPEIRIQGWLFRSGYPPKLYGTSKTVFEPSRSDGTVQA